MLVIAVQTPYFQTKLVKGISKVISRETGFHTSIDRVSVNWFDIAVFEGFKVYDTKDNLMLDIPSLTVDFELNSLINNSSTKRLDLLEVWKGKVFLTKTDINDSTRTLNIDLFLRNVRNAFIKKSEKEKKYSLLVSDINIIGSELRYLDPDKDSITNRFDYAHFLIENINGEFSETLVIADTIQTDINSLEGTDKGTNLKLEEMKTFFRVSQSAMEFYGLELKAGNSSIKDTIKFTYNSMLDLANFNQDVNIHANLNQTILHSKDLALFAPSFAKYNDSYKVSGIFNGKISSFNIKDIDLQFGNSTDISGKVSMYGLPNIDETFIDFNLTNSTINIHDIGKFLTERSYNALSKLGQFGFDGTFIGYKNDFVATGDFHTKYGRVLTDINLKIAKDINSSKYKGSLNTSDFNLGQYTGQDKILQHVSLRGDIEGSGLVFENADFELRGNIQKIGFYNYDYQNITTDARFSKELFEGELSIDDPNLQFQAQGAIDLRDNKNTFNIQAQLDTAYLHKINLSPKELFVSANLRAKAQGLKLDSIEGKAKLEDLKIIYDGQTFETNLLEFLSKRQTSKRTLKLKSDFANIDIYGDYNLSTAFNDFKELLNEYYLNIKNDREKLSSYYQEKALRKHEDYQMRYRIDLLDINPVLHLLSKGTYISENTRIAGAFTGGYTSMFSIDSNIDSLVIDNTIFKNTELDISSSKIADSTNVLAIGYIFSEQQELGKALKTKNLMLEGIWNNDHIDFEFDIQQQNYNNYIKLTGMLDFLKDRTNIKLDTSDMQILDTKWNFAINNLIELKGKELAFYNLNLSNDNQSLSLNGFVSEDPSKKAVLDIDNFKLENINPVINKKLEGTLNGYVHVQDYYKEFITGNRITLDNFTVNDFPVGDILALLKWDNKKSLFETRLYVDKLDQRIVSIRGNYTPSKKESPLNLKAKIDKANLNIVEPFIGGYFSEIGGVTSGDFTITNTLRHPVIKGNGLIDQGNVKVNYLNTSYAVKGNYSFNDDKITFTDLFLRDKNNSRASLSGALIHDGFRQFIVNLNGTFKNFNLLNTSAKDNNLFYGDGFGSGRISFVGPLNNMTIDAYAKSDKGTKIFIPIGGGGEVEQEEYIQFLSFTDSVTTVLEKNIKDQVTLKGLKFNFDLDITEDAYCEIIFDIKAGDIIRGRGNGQLKLQIDTQGEFNMFGDYIIKNGGYNFTLYNIINKEFEILPDSKISWHGDPYEGILDINATYKQLASLAPLLDTASAIQKAPEIKRKYASEVLLDLEGPLLSPSIGFDILLSNYPKSVVALDGTPVDLDFEVNSFKNRIANDEQELKRQVFSLIILRSISPPESFATGGVIGSSVSEFVSNQLSYWVSQVDENLEVDVDLGNLDEEAFNTFQLRLSYTFLNGRLRVTRDGGFTNQYNQTDISSIAGDWTVEYVLTPDGKFRAKMYNRTNFSSVDANVGFGATTTAGVSLLHTQSFNDVKELFSNARKRGQREKNKRENLPTSKKEAISNEDEEL